MLRGLQPHLHVHFGRDGDRREPQRHVLTAQVHEVLDQLHPHIGVDRLVLDRRHQVRHRALAPLRMPVHRPFGHYGRRVPEPRTDLLARRLGRPQAGELAAALPQAGRPRRGDRGPQEPVAPEPVDLKEFHYGDGSEDGGEPERPEPHCICVRHTLNLG
ncbi:hypothetical protein GCM10009853_023960 [Glycomyces scopariae]